MELTVKTTAGLVRGEQTDDGVAAFRGIPFAKAPVGALRFRAPVRPEGWDGARDATRFGDVVPQLHSPGVFAELFDPTNPQGPDCLNLNVWTPDVGAVGLPVLVWIHGGAFVIGSGSDSLYDGATFARDGVVTVTINYRLGVSGFHHVGNDVPGSGAFAILDQIAALEWVQENIAAFGGDPNRVTIAGESAGGMSVGTLMGAPGATGLFSRAIVQSGSAHQCVSESSAALIAGEVALALGGVDPLDATDEQLIEAQRIVTLEIRNNFDPARFGADVVRSPMPWQPMLGGDVLPERAIDAIAAGAAKGIDVLVGSCRDEMMLFLGLAPELTGLGEAASAMLYALTFGERGEDAVKLYASHHGDSPLELLSALETDRIFRIPGVRLAEAQVAQGARAFSYLFSWETPTYEGRLKAAHAMDLPFTWDHIQDPMGARLVGSDAPQSLADDMHGAWVRFITDGDPGWPAYDLESRTTRNFGGDETLVSDPYGDERELWDGVL